MHNHQLPRLSDLDKKMIDYIPQGGNWMSLPEDFPSQRIQQIREMSKSRGIVRTSYYGRLRPEQPSYTISTYYNRPGNGTNIHPWENRTISTREAARLQSFPDWYFFEGSETAVRNQVGNAVPPLLAYKVAEACSSSVRNNTVVDVFCGAGGLSLGFVEAGFNVMYAMDIDKFAIKTHQGNQQDVKAILGDISNELDFSNFVKAIKTSLGRKNLGMLIGGPPCQGFSTAGWRNKADHRNDMIWHYLRLLEELSPDGFLIENVEGILSMKKGSVIEQIKKVGASLGYVVQDPWVLRAEQFGVPQMRKRVFIIGTKARRPAPIMPQPVFELCKGRRETYLDRKVENYPITVSEAFKGIPSLGERIITQDLSEFDRDLYSRYCRGKISASEFFESF